jgi:ubiquitin carboxyl-terminal hydrolase 10
MSRRSFIEKLPPILILHLKRFVYDGHQTKKVWKKIAYPLDLEIPLDVISPSQRGTAPPKFQLFGGTSLMVILIVVIYHHGTSATGGHYTADVLLQDGNTWLNLDDTKLKWIDKEHVAVADTDGNWGDADHHVNGDDGGWNNVKSKVAYILLYKRVHV